MGLLRPEIGQDSPEVIKSGTNQGTAPHQPPVLVSSELRSASEHKAYPIALWPAWNGLLDILMKHACPFGGIWSPWSRLGVLAGSTVGLESRVSDFRIVHEQCWEHGDTEAPQPNQAASGQPQPRRLSTYAQEMQHQRTHTQADKALQAWPRQVPSFCCLCGNISCQW